EILQPSGIEIQKAEDTSVWCRLILEGFSELQPVAEDAAEVLIKSCCDFDCFVASVDGALAGGGAMNLHEGAAALFGDATLAKFRCRGAQQALIAHRVRLARE